MPPNYSQPPVQQPQPPTQQSVQQVQHAYNMPGPQGLGILSRFNLTIGQLLAVTLYFMACIFVSSTLAVWLAFKLAT